MTAARAGVVAAGQQPERDHCSARRRRNQAVPSPVQPAKPRLRHIRSCKTRTSWICRTSSELENKVATPVSSERRGPEAQHRHRTVPTNIIAGLFHLSRRNTSRPMTLPVRYRSSSDPLPGPSVSRRAVFKRGRYADTIHRAGIISFVATVVLAVITLAMIGTSAFGDSADLSYRTLDYDVTATANGDLKVTHIDVKMRGAYRWCDDQAVEAAVPAIHAELRTLTDISDISVRNVTDGIDYAQQSEPSCPVTSLPTRNGTATTPTIGMSPM